MTQITKKCSLNLIKVTNEPLLSVDCSSLIVLDPMSVYDTDERAILLALVEKRPPGYCFTVFRFEIQNYANI